MDKFREHEWYCTNVYYNKYTVHTRHQYIPAHTSTYHYTHTGVDQTGNQRLTNKTDSQRRNQIYNTSRPRLGK